MFSTCSAHIQDALLSQWASLRASGLPEARRQLAEVMNQEVVDAIELLLLDSSQAPGRVSARSSRERSRFDGLFGASVRRREGIYYTPRVWSDLMATALEAWVPARPDVRSHIADLAAGDGALLCAALRACPECIALGVEKQPASALSAAMNLIETRRTQGWPAHVPLSDRIIVGSGLGEDVLPVARVACVLGNPPYLGEKGNGAFFEELARAHPHLAPRIAARVDLLYLFMYRALDVLEPGGVMVHLTSAYWLQATGAARLREELVKRAQPVLFWQKPAERLFADAPGHHSLISVWRRADHATLDHTRHVASAYSAPLDERGEVTLRQAHTRGQACVIEVGGGAFRPFVDVEALERARDFRARSACVSDFFTDCQGFVSGADRVTRAHARSVPSLEVDAPLFLFEDEAQIPEALRRWRGDLLLPVLRASLIRRGEIWREVQEDRCGWALYIDGALEGARLEAVEAHLGAARSILERRREVRTGRIPWYRMHWPRARRAQRGDKLVMARRGASWCVALDLAGHVVSSDCTYLYIREGAERGAARRGLMRAAIWLEQQESARDLEVFGKQKGSLYEFYSEPLRPVAMALRMGDGGELVFDEQVLGQDRVRALEEEMRQRFAQNQELA